MTIPAGALQGSAGVRVAVQKVDSPPASPSGFMVLGTVFEFRVEGSTSYSFNKPVTLTFTFDPARLAPGETPEVYYYDDAKGQWVTISGTVSGNTITVTVDHFTKYAIMEQMEVMAAKAARLEPATSQLPFADSADISPWAKDAVAAVVKSWIMNGYPDMTFKPKGSATRAEAVTVVVNSIKQE